jgi:hypothetical protein
MRLRHPLTMYRVCTWDPELEVLTMCTIRRLRMRKGCVDLWRRFAHTDTTQGYRKVSPLFVPRLLINLAAGHVSMRYGFKVSEL